MPPKVQKPRQARYFPGKRTSRSPSPGSLDSDSDHEDKVVDVQIDSAEIRSVKTEEQDQEQELGKNDVISEQISRITKPVIKNLKKVNLNDRFKEERREFLPEVDNTNHEESEEGSEEESSEGETESESEEEEEDKKVLLRPVFVPKNKRNGAAAQLSASTEQDEDTKAQKKEETLQIIEQQIRVEAEAHAKASLHEDNAAANLADIDDADDLDPLAERAAWKLRELKRVKREREELEQREKELEEIERRRNLTEDQRMEEDGERLRDQQDEKRSRKIGFMQKYYHKGAFYQDMEILKRDYTEANEDAVKDKSVLPKAMQVRDDNLGLRGRSKYTHLLDQDTSKGQDSPWFKKNNFNDRAQRKSGGLHDVSSRKRYREDDDRHRDRNWRRDDESKRYR
ncbi:splicing factor, Prp19-binding domain-containing protein [Lipomyces japonicus]|uniref:splicing factor, Prp19-binding domain-containing protein n=1 Tax=Lipomyces japonicus TaxID=56871 RepID=UPI0034CEC56A